MSEGKIKWFNPTKGFGFIEQEDGEDLFVHINELKPGEMPQEGDVVSFTVGQGKKGPCAMEVSVRR